MKSIICNGIRQEDLIECLALSFNIQSHVDSLFMPILGNVIPAMFYWKQGGHTTDL